MAMITYNIAPKAADKPLRGWYVARNRATVDYRVVLVTGEQLFGHVPDTVLYFHRDGAITHGSIENLHRRYDIVRPLGPDDSITITGE